MRSIYRLLVSYRPIMRGQHSGLEEEASFSEIATFREGHIILIELFLEHVQALAAVGMADEAQP